MRPGWLDSESEPLLRRLALLPLEPLGWAYGAGARAHRALYGSGLLRRDRLPCRVVSVGSLLVGGSAKTPAAAWLARALHRRGHRVVLASRGYGRRGRAPVVVVSDGRHVLGRAETAGDEPLVLAAHAAGVPVLVGGDRVMLGWRALAGFGAEVLVLDDGFQHHRLHRDVDVVLVDAGQGFGNGRCLPRGPLREPLSGLRRAHVVGVVDGELGERQEARLERWSPGSLRFSARRRPLGLRRLGGGASGPPGELEGRPVGMLCALARPATLRRSLEALGARVVAERCFGDHHRYQPSDVRGLAGAAPLWVTTEKDAVKIPTAWVSPADVRVLAIGFAVEREGDVLDWLEARLR